MVQYGILTKDFNLSAALSALEEDGKVKILSRPSITTMDNRKAIIKSGKDVPFSTLNREGDPIVQWQEAVLLLEVTPHLIDEDELTLDIEILNDEVDFSETVDGNPVIQKKQARSSLILRDGETTVIAGLSKNNLEQTDSGIPFLKDIPLIGMLFKYKRDSDRSQEMVIFITPRIVDERQRDESEYVSNWIDATYNK
jgi:type IV pilus assembly protein PilQ